MGSGFKDHSRASIGKEVPKMKTQSDVKKFLFNLLTDQYGGQSAGENESC